MVLLFDSCDPGRVAVDFSSPGGLACDLGEQMEIPMVLPPRQGTEHPSMWINICFSGNQVPGEALFLHPDNTHATVLSCPHPTFHTPFSLTLLTTQGNSVPAAPAAPPHLFLAQGPTVPRLVTQKSW